MTKYVHDSAFIHYFNSLPALLYNLFAMSEEILFRYLDTYIFKFRNIQLITINIQKQRDEAALFDLFIRHYVLVLKYFSHC